MKKIIYLSLLLGYLPSYAQTLSDVKDNAPISESPHLSHERQVSSTLREISNLKLQLEKKKLQMEINKLEESSKPVTSTPNGAAPTQLPVYSPFNLNNVLGGENKNAARNVKVLMIYGPTEDLMAKISVGTQGGYVVKKGDIMPDGKTVTKVNKNFIEVVEDVKNPVDIERIFVFTQYNNTNNTSANDGGNKSSTSIAPTSLPMTNPGITNPSKISNMLSPIPTNHIK